MGRTRIGGRRSSRLAQKLEEARLKEEREYWRRVWESDGFDIDHLETIFGGLLVFKCKSDDYSVPLRLYAKMGLHQYNSVMGTNLQLQRIEKYNRSLRPCPSSYYITLVAADPSIGRPVTFQTCIGERSFNEFDVQCRLARPKSEATKFEPDARAQFRHFTVPECWPSDNDLADKTRFYVVQESDFKEHDWIRLYMELAFATTHRFIIDNPPKLSDLEIVKVETRTRIVGPFPPNEKLKRAINADIYIEYTHDLGKGLGLRKYRVRIRRVVDVRTRLLSLVGDIQDLGIVGDNQDLGLVGDNQEVTFS